MENKCKHCGKDTEGYKCDVCGVEAEKHAADHACGGDRCVLKCKDCKEAETKCSCE